MIKKKEKKIYYVTNIISNVVCDNCGKSLANRNDFIHRIEISSLYFKEDNPNLGNIGFRDYTLDLCEECAKPVEELIKNIDRKKVKKCNKTVREFAKLLNNREYGKEITDEEIELAKELGFVAVFGTSDDLVELRGAINDEIDCYDGGKIYIGKNGEYDIFEECECGCKHSQIAKERCKLIEVLWCKENNVSWTYKTDIPHETFNILEGNEIYCRGIIFEVRNI